MYKLVFFLLLTGCYSSVDVRGFNPSDVSALKIQVGKDTKDDVLKAIGTPTFVSSFDESIWYYVYKKTSTKSFFKPKTIEQKTWMIRFDQNGIVIENKLIEGEMIINMHKDTTPIKGHETGAIKDVLGNFGRYSYKKQK